MSKVVELKTEYGELQARLLTELFDLPGKAQQVDVSMSAATKESLGARDFNRVRAAEGAVFAESERQRIKAEYERLGLEMRAAVEEAVEEAERRLSPTDAPATDLLAAVAATPEQLMDALDAALQLGEAGENTAKLFFQVARRRDLSEVIARAVDMREDWSEIYEDILEGGSQPDFDPGDRFELLAPKSVTKQDILVTPQSDANIYGSLR
jgi:hypothetical protein